MKFVDIKGTSEVMRVDVILPKLTKNTEYFYPDGMEKGFWKKETYFIRRGDRYYKTPQEALKGFENLSFIDSGKIWDYGRVVVILRSQPDEPNTLYFKETKELTEFLDNLGFRWGVDLNSLVCLETPKLETLYEHKVLGADGFKN